MHWKPKQATTIRSIPGEVRQIHAGVAFLQQFLASAISTPACTGGTFASRQSCHGGSGSGETLDQQLQCLKLQHHTGRGLGRRLWETDPNMSEWALKAPVWPYGESPNKKHISSSISGNGPTFLIYNVQIWRLLLLGINRGVPGPCDRYPRPLCGIGLKTDSR